ncbi:MULTISPECIES: bifunctional TVP38/TMEM64 family protein/FAD-dependent oxidoreductase [unclassified Halomonas]|uniref:FAD-dependent oxidoreductase n=1 Tax=unclassified Halomonas TaxID=2609666 RepID=UPI0007DA367E|nr:bifunctional TVP38/TMEM64 family protein/FAD-dependent oxidoreductase [Halomonas sp. ALS9]MBT2786891.1 FAD-dependent oxidoreductase [Halomonas sp. ISL-106]MBT2798456.1 FAD-dependent oxidoreductase [Halomonas sp. ISL-104]OAL58168.1 pyridine nucleotide-disulfide oxidoreductase [Halomonas sp. ALS9]
MTRQRLIIAALLIAAIGVFFLSGAHQWFTLETIKAYQSDFQAAFNQHPWQVAGLFFAVYVTITALSLPGATLLTLLGGTLFGLGWGLLIISFASTMGATLAFLLSRFLFQKPIEKRFPRQFASVNRGVERDGALYLFTLRLVPVFPFFMINLVMGLTQIKTVTFYWVSQVAMLPGTAIYVNAGGQLGDLESLGGILSPTLIASFLLLAIFPWIARRIVLLVQKRKAYQGFTRPAHFDYDIVVIGGGSAGLVTSYIASAVKAKVALVEKHKMGGDCLNTGCVPSKALIRAARAAHEIRTAHRFGVTASEPQIDFAKVMGHVKQAISAIEPHDSVERYNGLGVEVYQDHAKLTSPWEVQVGEKRLTARHIVLATGARPKVPSLAGIEHAPVLTSENLWSLTELPNRLVVLGGGAIGCELSQSFARLGSQVSLVEGMPQLLGREDQDVGEVVENTLASEGVTVMTDAKALEVLNDNAGYQLVVEHHGERKLLPFDYLLVSVGRQANVEGLGLDELGITTTQAGILELNERLQTRLPNIWACGDLAGPYQLTHAAAHQAWHAAVNALFGELKSFAVDYRYMPAVTYVQPEVARVGLNEKEAKAKGIEYEITRYAMAESDRAIAEDATVGFIKVLTVPGKDKILGATIVAENAGEWLGEFTLAMKHGLGLNKLLGTIHPYPTLGEAAKAIAGVWKNAHKPERVLKLLKRYFNWRRGEISAKETDT